MNVFDELIKIDEDGNFSFVGWVERKHIPWGLLHCKTCLALDKCWFNNALKPKLPQHRKCHCVVKNITRPMPNITAEAKCDLEKFTGYIFSDKYAWNGKRDLFKILGFSINDSQYVKQEYENQAVKNYCNSKYTLGKLDEHGQRINIDIKFTKNGRNIVFTSVWMVRPKGEITNNTPLGNKKENI